MLSYHITYRRIKLVLIHHMKYIMKKVGIITICDYNNYGNRLQNMLLKRLLNLWDVK